MASNGYLLECCWTYHDHLSSYFYIFFFIPQLAIPLICTEDTSNSSSFLHVILIVAGLAMEAGSYMKRWLSNGWNGLSYLTNPSLFIFVGNTSYIWVGKTSNPCSFFGISLAQALKTRSSRESFRNYMELPDLYEGSTYLKPCIWPAS